MHLDFLLDTFREFKDSDAMVWRDKTYSYAWLLEAFDKWSDHLEAEGIKSGSVVGIDGDFSPNTVALMLAMIEKGYTIVPLTDAVRASKDDFLKIAEVQHVITADRDDNVEFAVCDTTVTNPILLELKASGHPGLVLFSSGSTGASKAAAHDFMPLIKKFKVKRKSLRTTSFLLFDHIGGINTMFYVLSSGGCLITLTDRTPDAVCAAVEKYSIELLPVSPTFINLILLSEAYKRHDLSSLKIVSYGTEPMPESTLKRFHSLFPDVRAIQTYGLSEIGIMQTKSKSSDSLWVKLSGEGFDLRIVDNMLEIKAETAMKGYLNAPSCFTDDGYMRTGDEVEVDGDYFLIKGRRSELINVGGQKVYPSEVESVIMTMDGVLDAAVIGEASPIMGQIVLARVRLSTTESKAEFSKRMRHFMKNRTERFKIPQKVKLVKEELHSGRFKKMRMEKS